MAPRLLLHEETLLLALKDREGTIEFGCNYQYALGGAILAELLLNQRLRAVAVKKKQLVEVVDATPLGEPVLDECLAKAAVATRRGSLETWVGRFDGGDDGAGDGGRELQLTAARRRRRFSASISSSCGTRPRHRDRGSVGGSDSGRLEARLNVPHNTGRGRPGA